MGFITQCVFGLLSVLAWIYFAYAVASPVMVVLEESSILVKHGDAARVELADD